MRAGDQQEEADGQNIVIEEIVQRLVNDIGR